MYSYTFKNRSFLRMYNTLTTLSRFPHAFVFFLHATPPFLFLMYSSSGTII